jgi:hypothetical protein
MKRKLLACMIMLAAAITGSHSQDQSVIIIERVHIPKHPQEPGPPQFILYASQGNFQLGLGGFVKLSGLFDFNGILGNSDFITYDIDVPSRAPAEKRVLFDAHQSRVFTEMLGKVKDSPLRIYLEADFYSEGFMLHLQHAYGQFKGFLLGQTWTTLMDLEAIPFTIDPEGPNSAVGFRTAMLRYGHKLTKSLFITAAIEMPEVSAGMSSHFTMAPQYIPDFILTLKHSGKYGHLKAGGIWRSMSFNDTLHDHAFQVPGYGGALSGLLKAGKNAAFMFQFIYGKGISKYIQDLYGTGLDAVTIDQDNVPEMAAVKAWGYYVAFRYNWNPKMYSTAIYGFTEIDTGEAIGRDAEYRNGQYASINLIRDFSPLFSAGIEYLWGQRTNFNKEFGRANRINAMVQFNF